jgi:hypothetical protein
MTCSVPVLSMTHTHTVQIWLTNPGTPILAPTSDSFDYLPSLFGDYYSNQVTNFSLQSSLFLSPQGTESVNLLMQNLQNYTVPNTLIFEEKAIIWHRSLLLNRTHTNNMTGFNNDILIAYGIS